MKRAVVLVALLAGCGGVSEQTHREVLDQLREARAQLDAERTRSLQIERQCKAAKEPPAPAKPAEPSWSQATPEDALETFIAAYRASRWDVIVRLVPNHRRDRLDEAEVERRLAENADEITKFLSLVEGKDLPIAIEGDTAEMKYADGKEVEFVREDGVWKIEDFD